MREYNFFDINVKINVFFFIGLPICSYQIFHHDDVSYWTEDLKALRLFYTGLTEPNQHGACGGPAGPNVVSQPPTIVCFDFPWPVRRVGLLKEFNVV